MILRVILIGILGPILALLATWYEPVKITRIGDTGEVSAQIIQQMRDVPSAEVLVEIRDIAVGARNFRNVDTDLVIAAADRLFSGQYDFNGELHYLGVPFDPDNWASGNNTWGLRFCSLLIPNLLARAYEESGDLKYLQAAVDYIVDWSAFESSLYLPRGAVFNDHAISARAVIVTDVWRLYRYSEIYSADDAQRLIVYARKLSGLLQEGRLYEFRTNHGLMQNLALLHLAIAFPYLPESGQNLDVGAERISRQLQYFINAEGVIQEHSPGYHHQFRSALSSAWRYLGLNGKSVSPELARRYERALAIDAALLRPDGTLPPIGDTRDEPYDGGRRTLLDDELMASTPLQPPSTEPAKPVPNILAPAAGYAILWKGLENWPRTEGLRQTVVAWANFPSGAHKHDDELSLSIWSRGTQWVRGAGYWPFVSSRRDAIGWRGSNAPHWVVEAPTDERSSVLQGTVEDEWVSFFDILRTNSNGNIVRRQLSIIGEDMWTVVDSYQAMAPQEAEIVWKFSPELTLKSTGNQTFSLHARNNPEVMHVGFGLSTGSVIDADFDGSASWNSGVVSNRDIVNTPAIRLTASGDRLVFSTVFRLRGEADEEVLYEAPILAWENHDQWELVVSPGDGGDVAVARDGDQIRTQLSADISTDLTISTAHREQAELHRQSAFSAFDEVVRRYGRPFRPALQKRENLTMKILASSVVQILLLLFVQLRYRRYWRLAVIGSLSTWVAFSVFIVTQVFA